MKNTYEKYCEIGIDGSLIGFESVQEIFLYFCYSVNAIGKEESILYCFILSYGEMVFACNPASCADI